MKDSSKSESSKKTVKFKRPDRSYLERDNILMHTLARVSGGYVVLSARIENRRITSTAVTEPNPYPIAVSKLSRLIDNDLKVQGVI